MDHVLTLLQLSVFLLPVGLILRDRGCFAFAARVFESISQRTRVCLGCKAVAWKTKQRWPFDLPSIVEVEQVAVPPCTEKGQLLASRSLDTLHFSPHVPTEQGHHFSIAVDKAQDDWEEEEEKQGKANEMNEFDGERGSATPASASAGYRSESDVSVIAQGADYSASGGDISLVDLRQSLTMFTLEVKDVAASSSFAANRNKAIATSDVERRGHEDTQISVVEDVGATGASCTQQGGLLRRRQHQPKTSQHAEVRALKAQVASLQQQVAHQTRSADVPRLNLDLDASHSRSRGEDMESHLTTRTPRGQSGQLRPRVKEPTPRLSNGEIEAKKTMERQGVVLVGARPASIRFAGVCTSKSSDDTKNDDTCALARSLGEAVCSNGCEGPDNVATHWY